MKIKPIYYGAVLVVAFFCIAVAAQAGNAGKVAEPESTFLSVGSVDNSMSSNVNAVSNIIINMQNEDITAGEARDEINWKIQFVKNDCDCSPEEMQVNKRYIAFLEAAKDVTEAKMNGASDLQDKIKVMNQKKDLI